MCVACVADGLPMNRALCVLMLLVAAVLAPTAHSAGLTLREHSAVAQSRGLAVTAKLDDPSTVCYNPAGMAF